jgi:hypothetical protein
VAYLLKNNVLAKQKIESLGDPELISHIKLMDSELET